MLCYVYAEIEKGKWFGNVLISLSNLDLQNINEIKYEQ